MEGREPGTSSSRHVLEQSLLEADETILKDQLYRNEGLAVTTSPYHVVTGVQSTSPHSYDCLAPDKEEQVMPEDGGVGFQGTRKEKITSVSVVLQKLAAGNTIHTRGEEWKLTRAVVHVEDAWKGRVSPCPALDQERVRKLFKLRWRYRTLDFLLVHMFLVLSLLEAPAWCIVNKKCFWSCYPDFTRNYHMETWASFTLEGIMLTVLVSIALLDMVRVSCVRDLVSPGVGCDSMVGARSTTYCKLTIHSRRPKSQATHSKRQTRPRHRGNIGCSKPILHALLCFVTWWRKLLLELQEPPPAISGEQSSGVRALYDSTEVQVLFFCITTTAALLL